MGLEQVNDAIIITGLRSHWARQRAALLTSTLQLVAGRSILSTALGPIRRSAAWILSPTFSQWMWGSIFTPNDLRSSRIVLQDRFIDADIASSSARSRNDASAALAR
jgi:hypothetical protein